MQRLREGALAPACSPRAGTGAEPPAGVTLRDAAAERRVVRAPIILDGVPNGRLRRAVITLGLALLLGLTIYVGLRWQLQSLAGYFTAVVAALGLWASAFALQTYTAILPLVLGALASLLLALVGLRSAQRARQDGHGRPGLWILGTCLVVTPFLVIAVRSLLR